MEKTTIKQENRPDGVTNRTTEVRQALATAMSLFPTHGHQPHQQRPFSQCLCRY